MTVKERGGGNNKREVAVPLGCERRGCTSVAERRGRSSGLCRPGQACARLCLAVYWYFAGHSFADIGRLLDEAEDRRSVRGMTVGSRRRDSSRLLVRWAFCGKRLCGGSSGSLLATQHD